jgi:hypothetical protein
MQSLTARPTYESSVSMDHTIQSYTEISKLYTVIKHKNLVLAEEVSTSKSTTVGIKRPEKISTLSTRMSFAFN